MHLLSFLTDFGDPYLTAPAALTIGCWFTATRQWRAARCWAVGFVCGAGLVALTKFVYAGWNIGIAALHFTGVSGHTMLSAAVYPVAAAICAYHASSTTLRRSIQMGVLFSLAIGVSRVAFGYHSWSEVVFGWLVGGWVATLTLRFVLQPQTLRSTQASGPPPGQVRGEARKASPERGAIAQRRRPEHPVISRHGTAMFSAVLIVIALLCHGRVAPISAWISNIAPKVAGFATMLRDESRWRTSPLAELPTSPTQR